MCIRDRHHAWDEVLGQVMSVLKPGLTLLARAGAAVPEAGLELADEKGRVLADAELAWPQSRVLLLRADQDDMQEIWQAAQWQVLVLDESNTLVSGHAWPQGIAPLLGLELNIPE